jgi:hypothetical protein
MSGQLHAPVALTRRKIHWYPLDRRWVGPWVGLEAVEKRNILHCRESNPGPLDRSPLLHRLSYPGSYLFLFFQNRESRIRIQFLAVPISMYSAVDIVTGYDLKDRRDRSSSPGRVKNFLFSMSSKPVWGPPSLLSNGYRSPFLGGKAARA